MSNANNNDTSNSTPSDLGDYKEYVFNFVKDNNEKLKDLKPTVSGDKLWNHLLEKNTDGGIVRQFDKSKHSFQCFLDKVLENLYSAPQTAEEIPEKFTNFIHSFVNVKNSQYSVHVDKNEFISNIYLKFKQNNSLKSYNPAKAKFTTWLNRVLMNAFIDTINYWKDDFFNNGWKNLPEEDLEQYPENDIRDRSLFEEFNIDLVIQIINEIPDSPVKKLRNRILIKLKLFIEELFTITQIELQFILERNKSEYPSGSQLSTFQKIKIFIVRHIKKGGYGLKDKDVERLLCMSQGSVNETFQRAIKKYVIREYNRIVRIQDY